MVLDPYRASEKQINSVWESMQWEQPTGFFQAHRLASPWSPYESIDFLANGYHIFFCPDEWTAVGFSAHGGTEDFVIQPPLVLVFARGQGKTPAEIISTGRAAAESLAGLLDVLLGGGYPILTKAYEAVFRKDRIETIKYYPARTRVGMKDVTKAEVSRVLAPLANGILEDLPDHVRLALRWYGKGISEEHPVDKFISLYECSLAIVSRRHYNTQTPTQVEMHLLDECLETGSGMPSSLKTTSTRERSLVRLVESSGSETAYSRQTTLVSIRMRLRMWSLARHRC